MGTRRVLPLFKSLPNGYQDMKKVLAHVILFLRSGFLREGCRGTTRDSGSPPTLLPLLSPSRIDLTPRHPLFGVRSHP